MPCLAVGPEEAVEPQHERGVRRRAGAPSAASVAAGRRGHGIHARAERPRLAGRVDPEAQARARAASAPRRRWCRPGRPRAPVGAGRRRQRANTASARAAAGRRHAGASGAELRPRGRRPIRASHLVGAPAGRPPRRSRDLGLAQALRGRAGGGEHHLVTVAPAHQVRPHRLDVLAGGLDEQHARPARAHTPGLAAQPPPRRAAHRRRHAVKRRGHRDLVDRRGGIQADHEVQPLGAQQIEIRGRVDPAVDVVAPADAHRHVEPRDRARRRHGVGELGARGAAAAERDPASGLVFAGDDPYPVASHPALGHDAAHGVLQRLGRDRSPRQPAAEERRRACGAAGCAASAAPAATSPDRSSAVRRAGSSLRRRGRHPPARGRPRRTVPRSVSPPEWATMNHGGSPEASRPPIIAPAEVPTMRSALPGSQPVSDARASSAPVSHAPPMTPPAPRTSPTLTRGSARGRGRNHRSGRRRGASRATPGCRLPPRRFAGRPRSPCRSGPTPGTPS